MAYNTCEAPILLDYNMALAHYHSVKPVRKKEVRPLGNRRYYNMASIELHGDDVVLLYYNHPVVTWHPDNSLTVCSPMHRSAWEPDKLAHYLPPGLSFEWNKVRFVMRNDDDGQKALLERGESLHLKPVDEKEWHMRKRLVYAFESLPVEFNYAKRAGRLPKLMRDRMSPFLEWTEHISSIARTITAEEAMKARFELTSEVLGIGELYAEEMVRAHDRLSYNDPEAMALKSNIFEDIKALEYYPVGGTRAYKPRSQHLPGMHRLYNWLMPENQHRWYEALCVIVGNECRRSWRQGTYDLEHNHTKAGVISYVEKLVCSVHRDEVFKRVELPQGTIPSKTNREFFQDYSFKTVPEKTDTVSETSTQAGE